ncbi:MAG: HesA/MoeB/ThiF family protein [Bacteriovoracaceae bacterium]
MNWQKTKVLLIGAGGIGSPWLEALEGLSPLLLGVMDGDIVDKSNLGRQFIHSGRVGWKKTRSAQEFLESRAYQGKINLYEEFANNENLPNIAADYDLILDATDNFAAKYLISKVATSLQKKVLFASGTDQYGQVSFFDHAKENACLNCLYPENAKIHALEVCQTVTNPEPLKVLALKGLELLAQNEDQKIWHYQVADQSWTSFQKKERKGCYCQNIFADLFDDYSWKGQQLSFEIAYHEYQTEIHQPFQKPIVLTCESGVKARALCFKLRNDGIKNIFWKRQSP